MKNRTGLTDKKSPSSSSTLNINEALLRIKPYFFFLYFLIKHNLVANAPQVSTRALKKTKPYVRLLKVTETGPRGSEDINPVCRDPEGFRKMTGVLCGTF